MTQPLFATYILRIGWKRAAVFFTENNREDIQ